MNYREAIDQSLAHIEAEIKEELTAGGIARRVGYSTFHFCRVFALTQGIPLMEYVRKRRLLLAREELLGGGTITKTALDYGFETASGFSKAFRREFGYSPTAYLGRMGSFVREEKRMGEMRMKPIFVKKEAFRVAGYGIHTSLAEGFTKDVAAYWDNYTGENLEEKMYALLAPPKHGEVGLCIPAKEGGGAIYLFGVVVEDFEKVTKEMMTYTVPGAEYAVFTTPPVDNVGTAESYDGDPLSVAVKETWRYIFEEWFPKSGYRFDETKVDFEFYDERCHGLREAVMDIYVPILPKGPTEA